ncbi:MFS transporter [Tistrella bauzanensis]
MLAGKLGDMIGHRRSLVIGLVVFCGASILCAVAPTLSVLIAGRGLQGIGGAVLMAMPLSIAREVVAKDRIGSAMGLFGTMSAIGTALGPSLGACSSPAPAGGWPL